MVLKAIEPTTGFPADAMINVKPFAIPNQSPSGLRRTVMNMAAPVLEKALGLSGMNRIYDGAVAQSGDACFSDKILAFMGVRFRVKAQDIARIPKTGPLVIVANHPFGGVDGIVLHALLRQVRPDVKLMVTHLLAGVPEYRDDFLFFDNFGSPDAPAKNLAAMKSAIRLVRSGGALGIFPSGEVSHRTRDNPEVVDPQWSASIARLIQTTGAAVLPIYFDGHNSRLFQFAGLIHPRLRTALLGREILKRKRSTIRLQIGSVIPASRVAEIDSTDTLIRYLRARTYILQSRCRPVNSKRVEKRSQNPVTLEAIVAPVDVSGMQREIAHLPLSQMLLDQGPYQVLVGRASELPNVLREIGRLREVTFRKVGEGSGKAIDLDRFDQTYLHLFVWQKHKHEIVGAYRLAATDEILPRHGIDGLYTATLFHYRPELLEKINPALELGRSFIRPEYQREYAPLLLLWKGIGRFIARNPQYKMLLGPVSISNDYNSMSKHLLVAFLSASRLSADLARWVTPRNPLRSGPSREIENSLNCSAVSDVDRVDELVNEIESDRMGIPILLRQYLKLDAKLLAFNVDPDFGDVLDGLMLVDLTKVNRKMLNRYLGRDEAGSFLAHHAADHASTVV